MSHGKPIPCWGS